ncbi:MAG: replicative DNA helicase [Clostridiaceae bacterium]|jgi:replicative DNA helicase|nr:replicative DNA helicase [Clostridiaceae bacterium]
MDTSSIRVIPYNLTAEQSVLGAILLDSECIGTVLQLVRPDDFYDPKNKELFDAVLDLFNMGKPIDVITLAEQLKLRGTFEKVGGELYLVEIANAVPTTANVRHYTKIVADYAVRRRLIHISDEVSELAYAGEESTEKILDIAEQKIFDVAQNQETSDFSVLRDVISVSHANISERARLKTTLTGVPTGFSLLDDKIGGFNKSNLIILAARPAMGKTSLALNIAQNVSLKAGAKVAIFSLEMSKEEVANRIWFSEALIESSKIRKGQMQPEDWSSLVTAITVLANAKIYIDDTAAITAMEIRSKCRRLAAEHGLDLIIIDHIQLMDSTKRVENRQQEITEISRSLKMLAKDLNMPVLALSQLSRASATRPDKSKRPVLTDLRESGAIEQDADVVLMLHREDYYNENAENPGEAELIIAKNRNGETGIIPLKFQKEFTKFVSVDWAHQDYE